MTDPEQVWGAFSRDPRVPDQAEMRASDADRDVVFQVLTEAYAEGRITREELDSRTAETQAARTVGDLVPPLEGLVSTRRPPGALVPSAELDQRAVEAWRKSRREALWGVVSVTLITWTIWGFTSQGFPWPVFVMLAALLNLGRMQVQRDEIVRENRRVLEREQRQHEEDDE